MAYKSSIKNILKRANNLGKDKDYPYRFNYDSKDIRAKPFYKIIYAPNQEEAVRRMKDWTNSQPFYISEIDPFGLDFLVF